MSNAIKAKKFSEFLFVIGDILGFLEAMSVFRAPVTRTLVAINVAIHAGLMLLSGSFADQIFQVFGLVPVDFWTGSVWQPLTSMFLHGNIIHIAFNMLALWSLGAPIEHKVGSSRFAVLYFVSGLVGALFVVAFQSGLGHPTIGASGAVVGLLGALAVFFPRAQLLLFFFPVKARTAAIIFGVGSLLLALTGQAQGLSHLGHLGGLIGGVLFTWLALAPSKEERMDPGPSMGGGFRMGTRRTGPSHTTGAEEQVLRMMQELMRQRQSGAGPAPGERRTMKEINPIQDSDRFEEPPSSKPESSSEPGPSGTGKLYYDPASGRFFFK
ncbi:MAG TPA: hypothetical protein DEA96_19130 [Leptospiraceae bacterium]|nr:hypothetical protein [Spirochaetaceae bacterium]HBS07094.1 hypothetical protein [Leptospiraceae bacterium]